MSENSRASNIVDEIVGRHFKKSAYQTVSAVLILTIFTNCFLWMTLSQGGEPQVTAGVKSDSQVEQVINADFDTKQRLIGYLNAAMSKAVSDDEQAMEFAFSLLHHRPLEAWGVDQATRVELNIDDFHETSALISSFNYYSDILQGDPSTVVWAEENILASLHKEISSSKDKAKFLVQTSAFIDLWMTYYQALPATDEQREAKNLYAQRAKDKILARLDSGRI